MTKSIIKIISLLILLSFLSACSNPEQDQEKLIQAAMEGDTNTLNSLLEDEVNPNCRDKCEWTPLMQATLFNHKNLVEKLLKEGAKPELHDQAGYTPLLIAATHNRTEIIDLLLKHGANINHQEAEKGMSALMIAVKGGHLDASQELFKYQPDLNLKNNQGLTALDLAEQKQNPDLINLFPKATSPL